MTDSPIDMEIFQDAIHAWFVLATGLDTVWAEQSAPQPKYPFGTLQIISGPIQASPSWELRTTTDLGRAAGKEVAVESTVPCVFNISCQVRVGMPDGRHPLTNALSYINKALASLGTQSALDTLRESKIAVVRPGQPINISALTGDSFVSQSELEPTFGTNLSLTEYAGYIKTVHGTSTPASGWGIDQFYGDI